VASSLQVSLLLCIHVRRKIKLFVEKYEHNSMTKGTITKYNEHAT
jgi:hypothetical protein